MPLPLKPGYNFNFAHLRRPAHSEMTSAEAYTDFYGLSYVVSGERMIYSPNGTTILQQGDVNFIPRYVYTRSTSISEEPYEFILLKFTDAMLSDLLKVIGNDAYNELCNESIIRFDKATQDKIVSILNDMEREWNNYNAYSELVLKGLLYRLIIICLRERTIGGMPVHTLEKKHDCLSNAIKYIKVHLRENPSLKDTAKGIHVSPSYLSKIFINQLHTSFSEFVLNEKVQYAQKLLVNSKMSMTQIAMESGFSSNAYFSDCFKRNMGISPTQFRKENGNV